MSTIERHTNPTDRSFKELIAGIDGKTRSQRAGYFGIGICTPKIPGNVGTLWRTAQSLGAAYTFQIGGRYCRDQTDTTKAARHVPHFVFPDEPTFLTSLPVDAALIGVELTPGAVALETFSHPSAAVYVLGAETDGLHPDVLEACDAVVILPGRYCLNVGVAASIVMYDRTAKALS